MSELEQSALDAVRALQRPGSPDLLGRVLAIFIDDTPKAVETICEACESGDLDTVCFASHALKSSSVYVGAIQFSTRMANIESAAREDNLMMCRELVVGLKDHTQRVLDEILALQDRAA